MVKIKKRPEEPSKRRTRSSLSSMTLGALNYIRSYDEYGQPISLNYQGSESFQTLPGGIISIIVLLIMVSYTALRLDAMLQKKDWSITQQMIVAEIEQIKEPKPFNELSNISLALQINKKREKLVAFDPNA